MFLEGIWMKCHTTSLRVIMFFFLSPIVCVAQTAVTSIRGTIYDPGGAVIPNASVTVARPDTGFTQTHAANGQGEYTFQQISPGRYTIEVTAPGFSKSSSSAELLVNQPATVNFTMTVQASNTTVEVTTSAALLNTTDATIGTPFDHLQIQTLPFEGNNVLDLLSLQGGVLFLGDQPQTQQNTDSRSGAVNSARSDQSNVTLDGLDDNTQTLGFAFQGALRATRDSVEEFRVVTSNSNADSGRSSGAQVSLVTRSGTNQLHGSAYEYNRTTNTVANDWFNKRAQLQSGLPNRPPKLLRNTFGGSLGGPIKKDKFFFFAAYEGQKLAESTTVTDEVPTASLRAGNLTYVNASGTTTTLSMSDLAKIDPHCSAAGTCPLGHGANPAVLKYFSQYPAANGTLQGDGYNLASYTFASPSPASLATSIIKLDYNISDHQILFVRGNLQQDNVLSAQQFPGGSPTNQLSDNTRGLAVGHTWTITNALVNNLRYGFVRQGFANRGDLTSAFVTFGNPTPGGGGLTPLNPTTTTSIAIIPVHNVVDDVTWTKGRHTVQFGGNYRAIFANNQNNFTFY